MARSRNIKPGFFKNDQLAECQPLARLLFAGLWCEADRSGRLLDRPKKIKVECLPYDECDCDKLLEELRAAGFIARYRVGDANYIQVLAFEKHQNPHKNEALSELPAMTPGSERKEYGTSTVQEPKKPEALGLIPDSLNLIPDSLQKPLERQAARFLDFWAVYPNKKGKADAEKAWTRKKLDALADTIIADVKARAAQDRQWLDGYIPHGSTYVNAEGWQDAIEKPRQQSGGYEPMAGEI